MFKVRMFVIVLVTCGVACGQFTGGTVAGTEVEIVMEGDLSVSEMIGDREVDLGEISFDGRTGKVSIDAGIFRSESFPDGTGKIEMGNPFLRAGFINDDNGDPRAIMFITGDVGPLGSVTIEMEGEAWQFMTGTTAGVDVPLDQWPEPRPLRIKWEGPLGEAVEYSVDSTWEFAVAASEYIDFDLLGDEMSDVSTFSLSLVDFFGDLARSWLDEGVLEFTELPSYMDPSISAAEALRERLIVSGDFVFDPTSDPGTEPVDPGTEPVVPGTEPVDPGTEPVFDPAVRYGLGFDTGFIKYSTGETVKVVLMNSSPHDIQMYSDGAGYSGGGILTGEYPASYGDEGGPTNSVEVSYVSKKDLFASRDYDAFSLGKWVGPDLSSDGGDPTEGVYLPVVVAYVTPIGDIPTEGEATYFGKNGALGKVIYLKRDIDSLPFAANVFLKAEFAKGLISGGINNIYLEDGSHMSAFGLLLVMGKNGIAIGEITHGMAAGRGRATTIFVGEDAGGIIGSALFKGSEGKIEVPIIFGADRQ